MKQKILNPARVIAYKVLKRVSENKAYTNIVLQKTLNKQIINKIDLALVTELTNGTIRNQYLYHKIIEHAANRSLLKISKDISYILCLGAHQILSMRTSNYAAVDQSIILLKKIIKGNTASIGFANAVLRKISQLKKEDWISLLVKNINDPLERLSLKYSHPQWITEAIWDSMQLHGRSFHELPLVLKSNNVRPFVNFVLLDNNADLYNVACIEEKNKIVKNAYNWKKGRVENIPGFLKGHSRIQDVGSQLSVRTLCQAKPIKENEKWLDLCSGPGGKITLLSAISQAKKVHITAVEIHKHRANLVKNALKIFDKSLYKIKIEDGRSYGQKNSNCYDRVLVDAPCTGIGSLRRKPEIRWLKEESIIKDLNILQKELLLSAFKAAKIGGVIAYVTCSQHLLETYGVVSWLLKQYPGAKLLNTIKVMQDASGKDFLYKNPPTSFFNEKENVAQLWSDTHMADSMFCALLTKGEVC